MEGRRRKYLVFISGHGEYLYEHLLVHKKGYQVFEVWEFPETRFQGILDEVKCYLDSYPFDVCYVISGANDLIHLDPESQVVTFNWDSQPAIERYYEGILKEADRYIMEKYPASKVIFCPMVGMELSKVVTDPGTVSQREQAMVDGTVWEYNEEVRNINIKNGLQTPFLLPPIHRGTNGKRKAYYSHLSEGVNPSKYIMGKWAKALVHACNNI